MRKEKMALCWGKRLLAVMLAVSMMILTSLSGDTEASTKKNSREKTPYVVVAEDQEGYEAALDITADSLSSELPDNHVVVAELSESEVSELENVEGVIVEEDFEVKASGKSQKKKALFKKIRKAVQSEKKKDDKMEWNFQAISVEQEDIKENAEIAKQSDEKVKIAVLDSGIDYISGLEVEKKVNLVEEEDYILPVYEDMTGHGTGIVSIIASDGETGVKGINPDAEIYSVKVLDKENIAPISRIIKGIYWCIDHDINIINMSFGTSKYSPALEKAVQDAYAANILLIGAAGNGSSGEVEYPAAFKEVMSVASTNEEGEISSFSNTGDELDVAAPGEKIKTAGFFNGCVVTHGTSIAVPHVTGVASLLWQKDMTKSNDFIRQLISRSAREIEAFNECGLIDAEYAFEIYDDFAQSYHQNKWVSTQEVPENDKKAESFQCDEEDYVEGRWSITARFGHTNLVDYANTFYHISDANVVGLIKEGIVYPDKRDSGLGNDAHGNPEWHGSWYLDENGTNYLVNYIACYELMTRIALKGGDDSSFTDYTKIWGISKKMFNRIKGKISTTKLGNKRWSTILGSRNNKANRKYFLWGCALHNLTDIFAHSTKRKENGKIGAGIGHLN